MNRPLSRSGHFVSGDLDPVYMEWGTPVQWRRFLLFCVPHSVKTKETNPTRPGFPTPCKQALKKLCLCQASHVLPTRLAVQQSFLNLPRQNGRQVTKVYNNNRSQFALRAPFYCYQQVVIFFNKWRSRSLRWKRRPLLRITYCSTSVQATIMTDMLLKQQKGA